MTKWQKWLMGTKNLTKNSLQYTWIILSAHLTVPSSVGCSDISRLIFTYSLLKVRCYSLLLQICSPMHTHLTNVLAIKLEIPTQKRTAVLSVGEKWMSSTSVLSTSLSTNHACTEQEPHRYVYQRIVATILCGQIVLGVVMSTKQSTIINRKLSNLGHRASLCSNDPQ